MDKDVPYSAFTASAKTVKQTLSDALFAPAPGKLLTIIMPARNEEPNLARAYREVTDAMSGVPCDYEVILVDNASTDGTGSVATQLCKRDPRWKYVRFSRNFGIEASLAAGFRLAQGDAAIVVFADLQDPPELIGQFVAKWMEGFDVVYGSVRRETGYPAWKRCLTSVFYKLCNFLSDSIVPERATDFRLLSRRAIDALNQFDERNRYIRAYSHWIGLRQCPISYERRPRKAGKSKAPLFYMLNYAVTAITCFSIKPLQLFSVFGFATLAVTFALATFYLSRFFMGISVPGMTTVIMLLLAILGVVLLGFGTLGEYIGRIYMETKRRPLFIIDETLNMPPAGQHVESLPSAADALAT